MKLSVLIIMEVVNTTVPTPLAVSHAAVEKATPYLQTEELVMVWQ